MLLDQRCYTFPMVSCHHLDDIDFGLVMQSAFAPNICRSFRPSCVESTSDLELEMRAAASEIRAQRTFLVPKIVEPQAARLAPRFGILSYWRHFEIDILTRTKLFKAY